MIALPFKTAYATEIAPEIRAFFGRENLSFEESHLAEFMEARNVALSVREPNEIGKLALQRYIHHLSRLAPILDGYGSHINLSFRWSDGFVPVTQVSSSSAHFELAGCLWNLAALFSRQALMENVSTESGVRKACNLLTQAADTLAFLRLRVFERLVGESTSDLSPEGIEMASNILLAQAQKCFFDKALMDLKKPGTSIKASTLSKLASQCSKFFQLAEDFSAALSSSSSNGWTPILSFQKLSTSATASYWYSLAKLESAKKVGSGYGEALAFMNQASELVAQALAIAERRSVSIPPSMLEPVRAFSSVVRAARNSQEEDNRTIFVEPLPDLLEEVPSFAMAKAKPELPALYDHLPELFPSLVPPQILVESNQIKQKATELRMRLLDSARTRTDEARAQLTSVNLPGALEAFKSGKKLPDGLWEKIERLAHFGGEAALRAKLGELEESVGRAEATLDQVDRSLAEEERIDDAFRQTFDRYASKPSSELNLELKEDLSKYGSMFREASQADRVVFAKMDDGNFLSELSFLVQPKSAIEASLPDPSSTTLEEEDDFFYGVDTTKLEQALKQLASLIKHREQLMEELGELSSEQAVMASITSAWELQQRERAEAEEKKQEGSGGGASLEHLALADLCRIEQSLEEKDRRQDELIEAALRENEAFLREKSSDPASLERDRRIGQMEAVVNDFHSLHARMAEGVSFYKNLQTKLLELLQRCQDLAYTQHICRTEYEMEARRREEQDVERKMQTGSRGDSGQHRAPSTNPFDEPVPPSYASSSHYPSLGRDPHHQERQPQDHRYEPQDHRYEPQAPSSSSSSSPSSSLSSLDEKVAGLVEMGFERSKVLRALVNHDEDENAALNELLSS